MIKQILFIILVLGSLKISFASKPGGKTVYRVDINFEETAIKKMEKLEALILKLGIESGLEGSG